MHIGFIMDWNRRWATARNLTKHLGHHQGAIVTEQMVELCAEKKIETISFWALAKKNILERSPEELTYLYKLLEDWFEKIEKKCNEHNILFETIGEIKMLPESLQKMILQVKTSTQKNTGSTLIIALAYGWQDEIVRATKRAILEGVDPETLDETSFLQYLDSGRFPPPDLIIRTGGDTRHSWYFLYQAEYSEYYFTHTLWPDFHEAELETALASFQSAKRNFGK